MICTTVPARADVYITLSHVQDTNVVTIGFDATSETNLIRAFALDIRLDNDANIVSVVGLSPDYWVYPGSIQIAADGMTLEAASLYAPVGPGSPNAPAKSGDLAEIIVDGDTCLTITANVARAGPTGVVMEDPNEIVHVHLSSICVDTNCCPPPECMKLTCPDYPTWEQWDKPLCWCCARQCRGDADCIKTGPFWVGIPDLNGLRAAFNKIDTVLAMVPNGICHDCDHKKTGPFRVGIPDLDCFRRCFNKPELQCPECPTDCYNFWWTP
jgi:hypothetical protein